jgi:hypothetical protein
MPASESNNPANIDIASPLRAKTGLTLGSRGFKAVEPDAYMTTIDVNDPAWSINR